ncbi:MAG: hypothetical protein HY322_21370 [Betaproteobacteria bacterium]|nr:hypothetical protein [Betaproteobacteria bacterium]
MKRKMISTLTAVLIVGASAITAAADSPVLLQTEAQRTDTLSARHGPAVVQTRIASEFSAFAGSDANAQSLVTGLRNGAPITLSSTSTTSGGTASTTLLTFDPPTRPMGHGNVFISLALAKQQLAGYGISDPTPQEIQAALTGGTITTASGQTVSLQGVLTQRASGQGWGVIAKSQGVKLGHVVSALKSANQQVIANATGTTSRGSGAVAGSRASAASATTQTTATGSKSSHAHGKGALSGSASGIVNAGGTAGGVGVGVSAGARGHGAGGIVTGAGVSARGGASAPGLARGHSKP